MSLQATSCITTSQINETFLAATPLIAQTILDLTITHPAWLDDLVSAEPFPLGNGTVMQQFIFRGQMPKMERGWGAWKNLGNNQGCDPCFGPNCGYNFSPLGGFGMERRETALMSREYQTPPYCVSQIQYTYQFEQVMSQIVKNLWRQISFIKAYNINFNALTGFAKKYVVDSGGAKPNLSNPWVYPAIGTTSISNLNIELMTFLYSRLRNVPDILPYDVVDGRPLFALAASDDLLARVYRDDPSLRQDVRFSSMADANLLKYNFMTTYRGMFLPTPIQYPRRFNADPVTGEFVEVLPLLNDIPMEFGTFTSVNPAWEMAGYEEILIHGRNPFQLFIGQMAETLGENTSFGPQPTYLEYFSWINPQTIQDPYRRVGFWVNAVTIGIHQQYSEGVIGVMVKRPSVGLMFGQNPTPVCPVADPDCDNEIPATGCPCPLVISFAPVPVADDLFLIQFGVPTDAVPLDTLQLQLQSGGYVVGTVVAVSADGNYATVTITEDAEFSCNQIVGIVCADTLACSSSVMAASDCRSGETGNVKLILSSPIKATTAGDIITACFGDGTSANLEVDSVDLTNNEWFVSYAAGFGPTDDPTGSCTTTTFGPPVLEYAEFFALMPADNAATVAVGGAVDFPQNGPTSGTIVRAGVDTFTLPAIGTYRVLSQVSVDEPGQLVIKLNATELGYTVVGRATGTSQIVVESLVTTTVINSVLSIVNPTGNAAALTITPIAGGTNAVSASLLIERLAPVSSSSVTVPCTTLAADLLCDRGGIISVCVPPATDATCPACAPCDGADILEQCV